MPGFLCQLKHFVLFVILLSILQIEIVTELASEWLAGVGKL